jgi:hypothetical protein
MTTIPVFMRKPFKLQAWLWLLLLLGVTSLLFSVIYIPWISKPSASIAIPETADWVDFGTIFTEGSEGDWDRYLWGGFAATAVKKDGIYYLYYQGADGYSDEFGTVTWRAIGVATSSNGIHFTTHPDNPLIEWFPNDYLEEGAVSSGAFVLDDQVHLIYGANTEIKAGHINADGRLTTAADAIQFTDQGIVLAHDDNNVWASGDELFPVIAFEDNGRYFIYYIPNGVIQRDQLGVAWGSDLNQLQTARARNGLKSISAWGTGGYARVGTDTYALFINEVTEAKTEVRLVSLNSPDVLSAVQETYQFDDYSQATILLDEETQTWFMYYRDGDSDRYGVKLAPVGIPDQTPPTRPTAVQATLNCLDKQITLTWNNASDPNTGVAAYHIRRNGQLVNTTTHAPFTTELGHETADFTITAVNYHNTSGQPSQPIAVDPEHDC